MTGTPKVTDRSLPDPVEVAAAYMAALTTELDKSLSDVDFTAAADALRAGLEPHDLPVDEVVAAADDVLVKARQRRSQDPSMLRRTARIGLTAVGLLLDRVTAPFDQQTDLDRAVTEVGLLVQRRAESLAALADAVERADFAEVMRLRPIVEVELPVQESRAQLRLLELRVAQAEADQQQTARRCAPLIAASATAEQELQSARDVYAAEMARIEAAGVAQAQAKSAVTGAEQATKTMRGERDRFAAETKGQEQRLLRRIAGLPEPAPAGSGDVLTGQGAPS